MRQARIKARLVKSALIKASANSFLAKPQYGTYFRLLEECDADMKGSMAWLKKYFINAHTESYIYLHYKPNIFCYPFSTSWQQRLCTELQRWHADHGDKRLIVAKAYCTGELMTSYPRCCNTYFLGINAMTKFHFPCPVSKQPLPTPSLPRLFFFFSFFLLFFFFFCFYFFLLFLFFSQGCIKLEMGK